MRTISNFHTRTHSTVACLIYQHYNIYCILQLEDYNMDGVKREGDKNVGGTSNTCA